jgi:DNA-binding CsgD family transcriptional regulator
LICSSRGEEALVPFGKSPRRLALASHGRSSKQIARELRIRESTANFHIASVKRKFGMRARAQAVATVVQAGLIR